MERHHSKASGVGLERLCAAGSEEWMQITEAGHGVEYMEAHFHGSAYHKHRHDTYAICLTTMGVQSFEYRGATQTSLPGQVVVLHPDELHDGRAGTDDGFSYKIMYVEPALIFEAVQAICGAHGSLPFVRAPVVANRRLVAALQTAFDRTGEPLALDGLVLQLAEGLIDADPSCVRLGTSRHLDELALERARLFLDANSTRIVHSGDLETLSGMTRYELARQFRQRYGTSPYRYLLMRRLNRARRLLATSQPLADIALDAGFADQAHFSRMFKAAFGLTPARYRALQSSNQWPMAAQQRNHAQ